eukprot:749264-Hanusia_phi.AAC.4
MSCRRELLALEHKEFQSRKVKRGSRAKEGASLTLTTCNTNCDRGERLFSLPPEAPLSTSAMS